MRKLIYSVKIIVSLLLFISLSLYVDNNSNPQLASAAGEKYSFLFTGAIQKWTVPTDGTYKIEVRGARGGYGYEPTGEYGYFTSASLPISGGTILDIIVGGDGQSGVAHSAQQFNFLNTGGYGGPGGNGLAMIKTNVSNSGLIGQEGVIGSGPGAAGGGAGSFVRNATTTTEVLIAARGGRGANSSDQQRGGSIGGGLNYIHPSGFNVVNTGIAPMLSSGVGVISSVIITKMSTAPSLQVTTLDNKNIAPEYGYNLFKIEGFAGDVDNSNLVVKANVAGATRTTTLTNSSTEKPFSFDFDVLVDSIPNGVNTVTVTADDGQGFISVRTITITVKRIASNMHITLDEIIFYDTLFTDPELDPLSSERWKFTHEPTYFENSMGIIPDHNTWRGSPYTQFSKTGHYKIIFQGMDSISGLAEYQLWSENSPYTLDIYVHRKPVPEFMITVYKNNTGGFLTLIDDTSYDLDKQSLDNGIADREWNWKESTATTWTPGLPPINLTINRTYELMLRVMDHQGLWSDSILKTFSTAGTIPTLTNNPPVATMTIPSGSQASPTAFAIQKPSLSWNQTDPDTATVFKSFEFQVTNDANTVTVFSSGTITQNTAATSRSWTVTNDLPTGQKLRVRVRVNDGLAWSAWSEQTWMYINRPPTVAFDWSPKPVWESDTVTLTNQSIDLDGDVLTHSWDISGPAGFAYTATTTHLSRKLLQSGDYTVRLTVSDGKAQSSITRTLRVESLTLEADVSHTALWLDHHLLMGHETVINPKEFYTGEIFVVSAVGSPTTTRKVTASLDATGRDRQPIAITTNLVVTNPAHHFLGNLYDPILSSLTGSLPEGQYQIKFRIEYMNGVVKEVNIPIQIIGHVQGATNVHRVQ